MHRDHPVRLRLPPLRGRGILDCAGFELLISFWHQPNSPPSEGCPQRGRGGPLRRADVQLNEKFTINTDKPLCYPSQNNF